MSAYGTIARPSSSSSASVSPLLYRLPDDSKNLAVIPLKAESMPDELLKHLAEVSARPHKQAKLMQCVVSTALQCHRQRGKNVSARERAVVAGIQGQRDDLNKGVQS